MDVSAPLLLKGGARLLGFVYEKLERETGIEPATSTLGRLDSEFEYDWL